jgi:hypothetical protein
MQVLLRAWIYIVVLDEGMEYRRELNPLGALPG